MCWFQRGWATFSASNIEILRSSHFVRPFWALTVRGTWQGCSITFWRVRWARLTSRCLQLALMGFFWSKRYTFASALPAIFTRMNFFRLLIDGCQRLPNCFILVGTLIRSFILTWWFIFISTFNHTEVGNRVTLDATHNTWVQNWLVWWFSAYLTLPECFTAADLACSWLAA